MSGGTPIDLDKLRTIGVLSRGRTRDQVQEGRDKDGNRYKAVTDELNNTVTQRADDRQDVHIRAPRLRIESTTAEER